MDPTDYRIGEQVITKGDTYIESILVNTLFEAMTARIENSSYLISDEVFFKPHQSGGQGKELPLYDVIFS